MKVLLKVKRLQVSLAEEDSNCQVPESVNS